MRLKEPHKSTPVPYGCYQPETKFTVTAMNLKDAATVLLKHRQSNAAIFTAANVPIDFASCLAYVQDQMCQALARKYGSADQWCCEGGTESPFTVARDSGLAGVAGVVSKVISGVKLYAKWFGSGGRPVSKELAETRAAVCVKCPLNQDRGSLLDTFTEPVAQELMQIMGMLHSLKLTTSQDEKLHVCIGCSCPLRAKLWCDLKLIKSEMKDDVLKQLDKNCWITHEA